MDTLTRIFSRNTNTTPPVHPHIRAAQARAAGRIPRVAGQRPGLPLPNELILCILDHVPSAIDLLHIGRTCHQLRKVVCDPSLTSAIIQRERARLVESQHDPVFAGLSLLEALRKFILHRGRLDWYDSHGNQASTVCRVFGQLYASSYNAVFSTQTGVTMGNLAQFLLDLDDVVNYNGRRVVGSNSAIEMQVKSFVAKSVHNEHWPLDFLRAQTPDGGEKVMSGEEWLAMIKDVVQYPILQYSRMQALFGRNMLIRTLNEGFSLKEKQPLQVFLRLTGLPPLESYDFLYLPRTDALKLQKMAGPPGKRGEDGLSVRAIREFCHISMPPPPGKKWKKKLLDPENELLRAVVFQQVHAVPALMSSGPW